MICSTPECCSPTSLQQRASSMPAGLPVSTTQTICGALLAIGLTEGLRGVNWWACLRVRPLTLLCANPRCCAVEWLQYPHHTAPGKTNAANTAATIDATNLSLLDTFLAAKHVLICSTASLMPSVLPLQIFSGWVITILFACGICSLFVALGVNSPSRYSIDQINDAQQVPVTPAARLPVPTITGWQPVVLPCISVPLGVVLIDPPSQKVASVHEFLLTHL